MKNFFTILIAIVISTATWAQNCYWTSSNLPTQPGLVTFSSTSTFSSSQYFAYWNFGNGQTVYSPPQGSVSILYNSAGNYWVCLNIIDSLTGNTVCTYCDTLTIGTQTNNCFYTASPVAGTNTAWSFSGSPAYSTSTLQWNFGDGTSGTGLSPTHTYATPGTYYACMNEVNPNGVLICSYCDTIFVSGTGCQANFTYGQQGNTFSFIPAVTGGPVASYVWYFGNGATSNSPSVTYTYPTAGTYQVCLTITTQSGCTNTVCQTITVPPSNCLITYIPDSSQANTFYFQANPSSVFNNVQWTFGDGTSGTGSFIQHTYPGPGTYTACAMEVMPSGSVICSSCVNVVIPFGVNCNYSASPIQGVNLGMLFSAPSVPNVLYNWNFNDGTPPVVSSSNSVSHVFTTPGTYNVCLTLSQAGNTICTSCQFITVSGSGSCQASFSYTFNSPNTLVFSNTSSSGTNYYWNFGDGQTSTSYSPTHMYAQSGLYLICLTMVDSAAGCSDTFCDSVYVQGSANCTFSWVSGSPANPLSLLFAAQGYPGATYTWTWGDGTTTTTAQGPSVIHNYSQPGTYQVCLTIAAGGAIVCTNCMMVTVAGPNPSCQADFLSVSVGLQAYFINQSVASSNALISYSWDFGDGNSSTLQFPNHQYSNPGWYNVCLDITNGNCFSTHCDSIYIDTAAVNPINCNAYFVFTQTAPFNVVAVNLASGLNLSFNWNFGDGSTSTAAYPSHQYANTGSYLLCLTVSDPTGCSSTYCDTLTVDSMGNIVYRGITSGFMLNVLAPNQLTSAAGLNEGLNPIARLFPIPAQNELNLVLGSQMTSNQLQCNVLSVDGRMLMNIPIQSESVKLDISSLQQGIYMLEVISSDKVRHTQRFIKE